MDFLSGVGSGDHRNPWMAPGHTRDTRINFETAAGPRKTGHVTQASVLGKRTSEQCSLPRITL